MSVVVVIFPSAPQKIEGFQAPEVIPDPVEAAQNESPAPQGAALGINNILSALVRLPFFFPLLSQLFFRMEIMPSKRWLNILTN